MNLWVPFYIFLFIVVVLFYWIGFSSLLLPQTNQSPVGNVSIISQQGSLELGVSMIFGGDKTLPALVCRQQHLHF